MQKVPNKKNMALFPKFQKRATDETLRGTFRFTKHRFIAAVDPPQLHNKHFGGSRETRSSSLHPLMMAQMALC